MSVKKIINLRKSLAVPAGLMGQALLLAINAEAANWYVRPNSSGNNTGSDWNNAWSLNSINWGSVQPGDTLWLAGGNYGGGTLTTGTSGSSGNPILICRVQSSDSVPTATAGWSASFDSTVSLGGIEIPSGSYLTIDGRIHGGISITITASAGGNAVNGADGGNISNITLNNIACIGPYTTGSVGGGGAHGFNFAPSNNTVSNVLIHGCSVVGMGESLRASNWSNVIVEYCYLADTNPNSQEHEDVMYSYPGTNVTFRYNLINNSPNDGIFFEFGGATNFSFYGNIYYNSAGWFICTKNDGSTYGPVYIYNNIFMATSPNAGPGGCWMSNNGSSLSGTSYVENNIFYNVSNQWSGSPGVVSDYNAYNSGAGQPSGETHSITFSGQPWVNMPANPEPVGAVVAPWGTAGDFHLTSTAAPQFQNGVALAANGYLNVDMSGTTRGSGGHWTIGTYQYGASPQPTPQPVTGMRIAQP